MSRSRRRQSLSTARVISKQDIQWLLEGSRDLGNRYGDILKAYPFAPGWTARQLESLHKQVIAIRKSIDADDIDEVYKVVLSTQWTKDKEEALAAAIEQFGTRWCLIMQNQTSSNGVLSAFSVEQLRSKWRRMSGERVRTYRLLDIDNESGGPIEYRTHCISVAAQSAAKLGYELLRLLDLKTESIHAFQVVKQDHIRKIAVESIDDDIVDPEQISNPGRPEKKQKGHDLNTSPSDWVQNLSQDKALHLPIIWDLNRDRSQTPATPSRDHSTLLSRPSSPSALPNSQLMTTVNSVRLERKLLRQKLRSLKSKKPSSSRERERLKEQKRWIRLRLQETENYTDTLKQKR